MFFDFKFHICHICDQVNFNPLICAIYVVLDWVQIQCYNILWIWEILSSYWLLITSKLGSTFSDGIPSRFGTLYIHITFLNEFLIFFQSLYSFLLPYCCRILLSAMMLCVNLEFPSLFSSCRYLVDFMPIVCLWRS